MRKLKLLMMALALIVGGSSAWAVNGVELTSTTTDCFLYNVGAGQYLSAGDWWGTHAVANSAGMDIDLTKVEDGVYTIGTRQAGRYLSGVWMDGASFNFNFTEIDAENHYYTLSYVSEDITYYLYYTGSTVDATATAPNSNNYYWQVVTRADFLSSLNGATSDSPKDATGAIYNAGFFCLDYATSKGANFPSTRSWQGTLLTDTWGYRANESGNVGSNYCVEQYGKTFDNYQELTGMPTGAYVVKNQGFYKGDNAGYLYANDQQIALTKITEGPDAPDGYTGNDLQKASYAFGIADLYHNTAPTVLVLDGNLRVGTKAATGTGTWYCFDNFTLSYLGMPSVANPVDFTSNPQNLTGLISNADFSTTAADKVVPSGWTMEGTYGNFRSSNGAVECWHGKDFNIHQTLSDLLNGVYEVSVQLVNGEGSNTGYLYANSSAITAKAVVSQSCAGSNWAAQKDAIAANANYGLVKTKVIVNDGNLTIGIAEPSAGNTWLVFDNFKLSYLGTSVEAYALVEAQEKSKATEVVTALADSQLKTALNSLLDGTTSTVEEAISKIVKIGRINNNSSALPEAARMSSGAYSISGVEYKTATSDQHDALNAAITTHSNTIVANAATATTATATLRTAVLSYLATAEPKNEGEYFDITCLMANPDFDDNTITGWTKESTLNPNTRIQCNEFFGSAAFDFYQSVTGLPSGSYTLGMKAFQRPGDYNDVYSDYAAGRNNATAKIYVNSTLSDVKNIMAEMSDTRIYTDPAGEGAFNSDKQPTGATGYIPNSMEGAAAWFSAGKYTTEVAALVEDGTLRLGFKDAAHSGNVWTLFDEFRLHYYGSSKMIYYKQYLPQLEAEITANYLNNGAYSVLKDGQTERAALISANSANAEELNTEDELKDAIDAITAARDNFVAAKIAYDNLLAATTAYEFTEGDAPFEMNSTQKTAFDGKVSDANTIYSTGTASKSAVESATEDIANAYVLNVPDAEKEYALVAATEEYTRNGKAIVATLGETSANNPTGYNFAANSGTIGTRLITFNKVSANDYNLSYTIDGNTVYLTYGSLNGSAADWNKQQIQGTTESSKKGTFRIVGTTTAGKFKIYNTEFDDYLDCQDGGSVYTDTGIENDYFTLQEVTGMTITEAATEAPAVRVANVTMERAFNKGWNAVCLPFATEAFDGAEIAEFTDETIDGDNVTLKFKKVNAFEANKPYLVYFPNAVAAGKTFNSVAVDPAEVKAEGEAFDFMGTFIVKNVDAGNWVVSGGALKKASATISLKPTRTYFAPKVAGGARIAGFAIDDDETTGIAVIENEGKMEIVNSAYNLNGQKMNGQLKKGVYIINGKKTVVK